MNSENKLKHLEFIQLTIIRMAANSFFLKGWSVTLVAALFAVAAKDSDKRYIVIAYFPVLVFWILDAYFLTQERLFRNLYDGVRKKKEDEIDFSMNTELYAEGLIGLRKSLLSKTLLVFYISMILMMIFVMRFIG